LYLDVAIEKSSNSYSDDSSRAAVGLAGDGRSSNDSGEESSNGEVGSDDSGWWGFLGTALMVGLVEEVVLRIAGMKMGAMMGRVTTKRAAIKGIMTWRAIGISRAKTGMLRSVGADSHCESQGDGDVVEMGDGQDGDWGSFCDSAQVTIDLTDISF
jgi:hypothetical protein